MEKKNLSICEIYDTIDLNHYKTEFREPGCLLFCIHNVKYVAYSLFYRKFGDVYNFNDKESYPDVICRLHGKTIVDYVIFDSGYELTVDHLKSHFSIRNKLKTPARECKHEHSFILN
jgi:hypothetical protein